MRKQNTNVHERRRLGTALAVSSLLFVLGCGEPESTGESSPAESEPTASSNELCGVLTSADIEEVLGKTPGSPQAVAEGPGACAWPSPDAPQPLVTLELGESTLGSYDDFVADYGVVHGGEHPPPEYYKPVTGIGDWALYLTDEGTLRVFQGGRMLEVTVAPAEEEQAIALARKAMPRLP